MIQDAKQKTKTETQTEIETEVLAGTHCRVTNAHKEKEDTGVDTTITKQ